MLQLKSPIIGIMAGVAAGLMAVALIRSGSLALPMLLAAPAAVYLASLGWGTVAGVLAALVGAAIPVFVDGPLAGVQAFAMFFAPAAWAGHLANLGRPSQSGPGMEWFPLSGILLRLMLALIAGFVVFGIASGFEADSLARDLAAALGQMMAESGQVMSDEQLLANARLYVAIAPMVLPGIWLMLHVLVMHVSAVITARSGILARPPEDLAATVNLPPAVIAALVASVLSMAILPSPFYEVSAVATGVLVTGLGLVGLAQLHLSTRGRPGRTAILFLTYLLLSIFTLPILLLAVSGAVRSIRGPKMPMPPGGSNRI